MQEQAMRVPLYQIDAFTDVAFKGNPAAVCILTGPADDRWMQHVAQEMNLSETAFLYPQKSGYNLRWFTPAVEVDLCGHATLASAHILWESGRVPGDRIISFHTRSGELAAGLASGAVELDFPATPEQSAEPPPQLVQALGFDPLYVGKNEDDYLVRAPSEKSVRDLAPDFALLKQVPARGIMVTSEAEASGIDFVSRFFAPRVGIDEDPVTGSAHCCLGPFWQRQTGRSHFNARQISRRGGAIGVRVESKRVFLTGKAVTVLQGQLMAG
jgi:PhzF family phenazine biosynthesis protein